VDWTTAVRLPVGAEKFSRHRVQTSCGAHPSSYPKGTGGSFAGVKETGVWSWPPPSNAKVNMHGAILPLPHTSSWRDVQRSVYIKWDLIKHSDNSTL